jgi:hypothetical protein
MTLKKGIKKMSKGIEILKDVLNEELEATNTETIEIITDKDFPLNEVSFFQKNAIYIKHKDGSTHRVIRTTFKRVYFYLDPSEKFPRKFSPLSCIVKVWKTK